MRAATTTGRFETDGSVYAAPSRRHGLGVFAGRRFAPDDVVEECPVVVLGPRSWPTLADTELADYLYDWDGDRAIALGCGSLYNHSYTPNARYDQLVEERVIAVIAVRSIEAGEEITVNYGGDPDTREQLWFDPTE